MLQTPRNRRKYNYSIVSSFNILLSIVAKNIIEKISSQKGIIQAFPIQSETKTNCELIRIFSNNTFVCCTGNLSYFDKFNIFCLG